MDFENIGQVTGQGTSNIINSYNYTDNISAFGIVYYRLKQVDFDGVYEYSDIIAVEVPLANQIDVNVFPNPFSDETNISYLLPKKADVKIIIHSITGAQLKVLVNEVQEAGAYKIPLNYTKSGMMILHIKIGDQQIIKKIVKN